MKTPNFAEFKKRKFRRQEYSEFEEEMIVILLKGNFTVAKIIRLLSLNLNRQTVTSIKKRHNL